MSITSLLPHQGIADAQLGILCWSCRVYGWVELPHSRFVPLSPLRGRLHVGMCAESGERVGGRVNLSMLVRSLDIRKYLFEYKHQKNITHVSCQIHIAFSAFSSHWFQRGVGFLSVSNRSRRFGCDVCVKGKMLNHVRDNSVKNMMLNDGKSFAI